ncbi:uncharacterized protein LOC121366707 [Gigantopelta aegis]|uniref:uncharacterized protein LOC121366707 n=1 Tax=Gigantopelta aegis TaxID=1735272 RepID=UPI001B88763A|nr:uncharacterized protein LOC121366707 [Gigantopelta aegis]
MERTKCIFTSKVVRNLMTLKTGVKKLTIAKPHLRSIQRFERSAWCARARGTISPIKVQGLGLSCTQFKTVSVAFTMLRLNEAQRNNAVGQLEAGESQSEVARLFNVYPSTISRLWICYQAHRSTRYLRRSGRPRVTTPAQDRYIRLRHLRQRTTTATSTQSAIPGLRRISDQTVRNRLREAGLRPRRPVRGVI